MHRPALVPDVVREDELAELVRGGEIGAALVDPGQLLHELLQRFLLLTGKNNAA